MNKNIQGLAAEKEEAKEKEIEFLRKCCSFTGRFSLLERRDGVFCGIDDFRWNITMEPFTNIGYPIILQKAIEGVNRRTDSYIVQEWDSITANSLVFNFDDYESIDKCKRAVLEYVFKYEEEEA